MKDKENETAEQTEPIEPTDDLLGGGLAREDVFDKLGRPGPGLTIWISDEELMRP